jgi:hypothetical protein
VVGATPSEGGQEQSPFAVFDESLDAVTVLRAVRDGNGAFIEFRVAYANPVAAYEAGCNMVDVVGERAEEYYPEAFHGFLHTTFLQILETGRTIEFPAAEFSGKGDGSGPSGWYRFHASKFGDHVIVTYRDITAEHKAEQQRAAERAEARLLQEALLPPVPPVSHGLEMATLYLPASDAALGGDWYDAFPVDGGLFLGVGDVAGHGLRAVAVMTEIRNAIRGFASEDPSPARVLGRVNRMLCDLEPDETATALVALWRSDTRAISWSSAGHPPVLRLRAGETGYLGGPPALLLGLDRHATYTEQAKELRRGTTLVFYTDGLVEERGSSLDVSAGLLADHADRLVGLGAAEVCDELVAWRNARRRREDDLCLFAVHVR